MDSPGLENSFPNIMRNKRSCVKERMGDIFFSAFLSQKRVIENNIFPDISSRLLQIKTRQGAVCDLVKFHYFKKCAINN